MQQFEFVKFVLRNTRRTFPALYSDHMHGRLREFVQEYAPSHKEKRGEMIGSVPGSLRVLWAIGKFLEENVPQTSPVGNGARNETQAWGDVRLSSTRAFAAAAGGGFWEALLDYLKLGRGEGVIEIHHDWSVRVFPRSQIPELTSGILQRFALLLHTAGTNHNRANHFADR